MAGTFKPQKIRDPLHNLIEFDTSQFERTLWNVIQSPSFQRLRRIRQLGFSELVYPGATHTRFAHSIGVYHTARRLMGIISNHFGKDIDDHQRQVALVAALVHDLGHGMFSHAFEDIGRQFGLVLADHETVTGLLIRERLQDALKPLGTSFADEVATVIRSRRVENIYDAVVSSQFDADRLDYMQRDRLMAGVQNSCIDFTWLMTNLEVGNIQIGVDNVALGEVNTFVLGPKAIHAAETFVLALFQLYPTVYFHKATRVAQKMFTNLMAHLITLVKDGNSAGTGLPDNHPFIRFAKDPNCLDHVMDMDDTVFWGALPLLANAADERIKAYATALKDRRLPKCIDVWPRLMADYGPKRGETATERKKREEDIKAAKKAITENLEAWESENPASGTRRILIDDGERSPYKRIEEDDKGTLNQIHIRDTSGRIRNIVEISPVVAAIEPFEFFRIYVDKDDVEATRTVEAAVEAVSGAKPKRKKTHGAKRS